ncbi:uncharacterized protein LOC128875364 [Hylaeus volcanicus]|uniref:uncharacterized protein LOC128875364 n=1 Tax=Hylaeus volcanicus TaxID=313075 RepID=UPI0023B7C068|nr:uncharacterized protein LOC128875364 [Hylaeus volcanicus]
MRLNRLFYFIFILYCIERYKCGVSCTKVDDVKPLIGIEKKEFDTHNDETDSELKVRSQRQLQKINFNTDANGFIKDDRASRHLLGSRRHLRLGDANQIANYFLTGGPLKGHAHFVGASNCDSNNDESNDEDNVGMSNPTNENDSHQSANEENVSTNSTDPVVGIPLIPRLFPLRRPHLPTQPRSLYRHIPGRLNSLLHPPLHQLALPHIPVRQSYLRSILHPRLHPYINSLHTIPNNLVGAARIPIHSLAQAHSDLHQLLLPTLPPTLLNNVQSPIDPKLGSTHLISQYPTMVGASPTSFYSNPSVPRMIHTDYLPHLQPTGYIVKFVPHNNGMPSSSFVGSPQQQFPTSIDNNSNTDENTMDSTGNVEEDTNENQEGGLQDETNDCN